MIMWFTLTPEEIMLYNPATLQYFMYYSFTSTTMSPNKTAKFKPNVILIITINDRIYDISSFSRYQREKEVLLPAGTIFKFNKTIINEPTTEIYLDVVQLLDIKNIFTDEFYKDKF